jgi:hypothetical protein
MVPSDVLIPEEKKVGDHTHNPLNLKKKNIFFDDLSLYRQHPPVESVDVYTQSNCSCNHTLIISIRVIVSQISLRFIFSGCCCRCVTSKRNQGIID